MPIYEYRCDACKSVVEKLQKFSDPPLATCSVCGGPLEKLISPPGLHFKGTGWYVTDYAGKGNGKAPNGAGKNGDGQKAEPKKAEKKTDSKPAASSSTASAAKSK